MANYEKVKGDISCKHTFIKQEKETLQVLTRFCTNYGRTEFVSEHPNMDETMIKKIKGVN